MMMVCVGASCQSCPRLPLLPSHRNACLCCFCRCFFSLSFSRRLASRASSAAPILARVGGPSQAKRPKHQQQRGGLARRCAAWDARIGAWGRAWMRARCGAFGLVFECAEGRSCLLQELSVALACPPLSLSSCCPLLLLPSPPPLLPLKASSLATARVRNQPHGLPSHSTSTFPRVLSSKPSIRGAPSPRIRALQCARAERAKALRASTELSRIRARRLLKKAAAPPPQAPPCCPTARSARARRRPAAPRAAASRPLGARPRTTRPLCAERPGSSRC